MILVNGDRVKAIRGDGGVGAKEGTVIDCDAIPPLILFDDNTKQQVGTTFLRIIARAPIEKAAMPKPDERTELDPLLRLKQLRHQHHNPVLPDFFVQTKLLLEEIESAQEFRSRAEQMYLTLFDMLDPNGKEVGMHPERDLLRAWHQMEIIAVLIGEYPPEFYTGWKKPLSNAEKMKGNE